MERLGRSLGAVVTYGATRERDGTAELKGLGTEFEGCYCNVDCPSFAKC